MVGHCGASAEALDLLRRRPVDVVLLDFDLGEDHGSQFISSAREQGYAGKFLMITAGMTATESSIALQLGASGVFLKHNSPVTLAKAIRLVASGEMWVDQRVIQLMADGVHQREDQWVPRHAALSEDARADEKPVGAHRSGDFIGYGAEIIAANQTFQPKY